MALVLVSPSFVLLFPMLMSLDGWLQLSLISPINQLVGNPIKQGLAMMVDSPCAPEARHQQFCFKSELVKVE